MGQLLERLNHQANVNVTTHFNLPCHRLDAELIGESAVLPLVQLPPYQPPWWILNGHLQTIVASQFRWIDSIRYLRQRIDTPDGDFLDLDWSRVGSKRLVILSHGLEGNTGRSYMLGMVRAINRFGWDALAWNFRGCSGEPNRLLRLYHSGSSDDLQTVIAHALKPANYQRIDLVGFSVGGNITLKYLGETAGRIDPIIKRAVAISVPCDLASASMQLAKPQNRIYMSRFLRMLHEKIRRKMGQFPGRIDDRGFKKIRDFKDFDDRYTAPLHGFRDAEDYWENCSSLHYIADINIPTLLINASDDPFLSAECYPSDLANSHDCFFFAQPQYGGHVGFVTFEASGRYWSEQQALSFLGGRPV